MLSYWSYKFLESFEIELLSWCVWWYCSVTFYCILSWSHFYSWLTLENLIGRINYTQLLGVMPFAWSVFVNEVCLMHFKLTKLFIVNSDWRFVIVIIFASCIIISQIWRWTNFFECQMINKIQISNEQKFSWLIHRNIIIILDF